MAKKTPSKSEPRRWLEFTFPKIPKKEFDMLPDELVEAIYEKFKVADCFQCDYVTEDGECEHPQAYCPVRPDTHKCCRYCYQNCYHVCGRLVANPHDK